MKKLLIVLCAVVLSFVMTAGAWLPEAYEPQNSEFDVTQLFGKTLYEACDIITKAGYSYEIGPLNEKRPTVGYNSENWSDLLRIYSPEDPDHYVIRYPLRNVPSGKYIDFNTYRLNGDFYTICSETEYEDTSNDSVLNLIPLPPMMNGIHTLAELFAFNDDVESDVYYDVYYDEYSATQEYVKVEISYYEHYFKWIATYLLKNPHKGQRYDVQKDDIFKLENITGIYLSGKEHYLEYVNTVNGSEYYVCTDCGYSETRKCTYTYSQVDGFSHSLKCDTCGVEIVEPHQRYSSMPNSEGTKSCSYCGYTTTTHNCTENQEYFSIDNSTHAKICKICGNIVNYPESHKHSEDYTISEEEHFYTCSICHQKVSDYKHSFFNDVCLWCGYVRGTEIPKILGDLNSSGGDPDVLDGVVMQRILASLEPEITAADLNRDGIVNVADGVVMQRILAGLE